MLQDSALLRDSMKPTGTLRTNALLESLARDTMGRKKTLLMTSSPVFPTDTLHGV